MRRMPSAVAATIAYATSSGAMATPPPAIVPITVSTSALRVAAAAGSDVVRCIARFYLEAIGSARYFADSDAEIRLRQSYGVMTTGRPRVLRRAAKAVRHEPGSGECCIAAPAATHSYLRRYGYVSTTMPTPGVRLHYSSNHKQCTHRPCDGRVG